MQIINIWYDYHDIMIPDKTDVKILKIITDNSRLSYRKIAKKMGVSTLTVLSRMKKMEQYGIIKGYGAIIDHKKLGLSLSALIEVKTTKGHIVVGEKLLAGFDNIYGVWGVTGATDAIILAKFTDTEELSNFTKKILANPNINSINTHVVLETIKEDLVK